MRRSFNIKLIAVLIMISACTSGGSGGGTGGGTTGGSGGFNSSGSSGGSGGSSSTGGGTTTTGGTTGGTVTGGTVGGGSTGGGGGSTGGGGSNVSSGSVNVDATSGYSSVSYDLPFSTSSGIRQFDLTLNVTNTTSFQNIATYPGFFIVTTSLNSPSDQVLVPGPSNLFTTFALIPAVTINTLNYPTRSADPSVVAGSYLQTLLYDPSALSSASGVVLAKNDFNTNSGTLNVNIFLVGSIAQSNLSEVQDAVSIFRSIYSSEGISVAQIYNNVSSTTGVLPNPIVGSSLYSSLSASSRQRAVNLFIGDVISEDGTQDTGNELSGVVGVTSFIPGPGIPSNCSAVAISISAHQGPDGIFNGNEVDVLGETIAHETGHYLGLFHPVSTTFDEFDPLDDTDTCTSAAECLSNDLVSNMMYPTVVTGIQQRDFTTDQSGVVHRSVIVD